MEQSLRSALLSVLLLSALSAAYEEAKKDDSASGDEIGAAVSFTRDANHVRASYHTTRSSFLAPKRVHWKVMKTEKRSSVGSSSREIGARRTTRSLKYADACREDTNEMVAIVECTNAVRNNPDLFARDYPCSYDQWRGEVAGKRLAKLVTAPTIQLLAQGHTDDQARMDTMTHTGSDGSDLQTRADRVRLPWGMVGENVAAGFNSAKAVVMAWMCSPPHRKNLMACEFSQIGVGTGVSRSGRHFYTQVFSCGITEKCSCDSKKKPEAPPAKPAARTKAQRRDAARAPVARPHTPPPRSPHHTTVTTTVTTTTVSHGGAGGHPQRTSQPEPRCDWVNGVWTCGTRMHSQKANPYHVSAQG